MTKQSTKKKNKLNNMFKKTYLILFKKPYWILAGLFFTLYEGIYWQWGHYIFTLLGYGFGTILSNHKIEFLITLFPLSISIICFGLFIHCTSLHIDYIKELNKNGSFK